MAMETWAVIGGGSVAASFLHHLVRALHAQPGSASLRVLVFEPRAALGRGSAYADDLPTNLLNVTVAGMSVAGDDKLHFQRWLANRGIGTFAGRPIRANSFVSRALFGRYLEAVCEADRSQAEQLGVRIEQLGQHAQSMESGPDDMLWVGTGDGVRHRVQRAVLALGNLDSTAFSPLRGLPGFANSPYPTADLIRVEKDATVCILGTSLSAVDAIVALADQGHRGPIEAVSRHGRLPSVRGVMNPTLNLSAEFKQWLQDNRAHGSTLPLDNLIVRVRHELHALAGEPSEDLSVLASEVPDAAAFLTQEIAQASEKPRPWQAFGNALNEVVDVMWSLLSEADRQRFNREIKPVWMARRVSFPLENALVLRRLMDAGQLRISGGFESAHPLTTPGHFEVSLRGARDVGPRRIHAQALINATSFSTDAAGADVPLLTQMLREGLAVADPHGGLRADFDTGCLLNAQGVIEPRLSALGSMVAGTYFWTNAMDVNARLAMGQAQRLVALLAAR